MGASVKSSSKRSQDAMLLQQQAMQQQQLLFQMLIQGQNTLGRLLSTVMQRGGLADSTPQSADYSSPPPFVPPMSVPAVVPAPSE
jgi:hypothetical protein